MQMIAAAVSHRKKSAHPTFFPVIRKAFSTLTTTYLGPITHRNYLCQTKPKVKHFLLAEAKKKKKPLQKIAGIPL